MFRNSFKDIEYILTTCAENGTRFEFECYDIGHLYNLKHFLDRGMVKPPLFVQSVFGILGGIGTHAEDVAHMKRTADRLFGDSYQWSVLGAGAAQMRIAAMAAAMGGNVRVGLEDSLWAGPKRLARSSAEQVRIVRGIVEGLASPSPRPTKRAKCCSLSKAGARSRSDNNPSPPSAAKGGMRMRLLLHEPLQVHRAGVAGIDIAGIVKAGGFQRTQILGLRNIGRDLAVLGAADADALLEAGIGLLVGLRIRDIDHIVLVDGDAARPPELLPLGKEFAVLIENLEPVVGAVGDEEAPS